MSIDPSQTPDRKNFEMTALFSRLSSLFFPQYVPYYDALIRGREKQISGGDIPPHLPKSCQGIQTICSQGLALLSSLPIVYRYFETTPARTPSVFRLEDCIDRFKTFLRLPLSNGWAEFFAYWSFGYLREISTRAYSLLPLYDFDHLETEYALQRYATGEIYELSPGPHFVGNAQMQPSLSRGILISGNPSVSRCHADIKVEPNRITLMDRDSANGTFVNGSLLKPGVSATVKAGDVIAFSNEKCILIQLLKQLPAQDSSRVRLSDRTALSSNESGKDPASDTTQTASTEKKKVRVTRRKASSGPKCERNDTVPDFSLNFRSIHTRDGHFGFEVNYVSKRHAVVQKSWGSNGTNSEEVLPLPSDCVTKEQIMAYVKEKHPVWVL